MKVVENIEKGLDFFISESLKKDPDKWLRARAINLLLILILVGVTFYTVYFDLFGDIILIKTFTNYLMLAVVSAGVLLIKFTGRLKWALLLISLVSFIVVGIGSFNSGGIISSEIVWFSIISNTALMFIDKKYGLLLAGLSIILFSTYFYLYRTSPDFFNKSYLESGIDYELANTIFALIVSIVSAYILVVSNDQKQKKIVFLMNSQIKNIDTKYQFLINNSQDIISIIDSNMNRTFVSPSISNITGFRQDELVGENICSIMTQASKDKFSFLELKNILVQKPYRGRFEYKSKIGESRSIEFNSIPIHDDSDNSVLVLTREHDITEKVKIEENIKKLRHEIARDFHDGIGNKLATISSTSDLLKQYSLHENTKIKDLAQRIERSSSNLYYEFKDFIWSIDSKEETLDELGIYLRDIGQTFFEETGVNFTTHFMIGKGIILDIKKRRNIVLIVKESFTNILKHANAKNVNLSIQSSPNNCEIVVSDDGKGIDKSLLKKGMGMKNIRERVSEVGGNVNFMEEQDKGFSTKLLIPISTQNNE